MKKSFVLGLVFAIISTFGIQGAFAAASKEDDSTSIIKAAIAKYKNKNFIGCISDLRMYTQNDPSSAIAWYYLGNSYMNIAMKAEAHQAFDRVVQLNAVPKLTSYSIQAKICMENPTRCQYQDFTYDEINQLKADPMAFLDQYFASLNNETKDENEVEIDRLINGYYSNNMHPSARDFIMQERAKMKQSEMNQNKASIDTNIKTAYSMEQIRRNNEIRNLAMMMESSNKGNNNALMNYYQPNSNVQMTPEMVHTMMMQNMMVMPD